MANTKTKKKAANPLPYIIVFAILFLIALGVLTWVLDVFYKSYQCGYYPNIWCSDNWTCQTKCNGVIPGTDIYPNPCFGTPGSTGSLSPTGLASCLFGPDAPGALVCFTPPTGGTGVACSCPTGMSGPPVLNCFNGCGIDLDSISAPGTPVCCCNDQNNPNCAMSNGQPTGLCAGTVT